MILRLINFTKLKNYYKRKKQKIVNTMFIYSSVSISKLSNQEKKQSSYVFTDCPAVHIRPKVIKLSSFNVMKSFFVSKSIYLVSPKICSNYILTVFFIYFMFALIFQRWFFSSSLSFIFQFFFLF